MGNKFTQSVLQRLEQEQKSQTGSKPQTKTITKKTVEEKKTAYESQSIPDITEYLRLEPARTAKNKTFYLDVEVIEALCSAA